MRVEYNEYGIITKESFVDLLLNNGGILEDSDEYKEICRQWHEKTGHKEYVNCKVLDAFGNEIKVTTDNYDKKDELIINKERKEDKNNNGKFKETGNVANEKSTYNVEYSRIKKCYQSQVSTTEQLHMLTKVGVKLGLYDAVDWIKNVIDCNKK